MKRGSLKFICFVLGFVMAFLIIMLLSGCTQSKTELETIIVPKITRSGITTIAVEYMLGDLLVIDEWETGLNAGEILFLIDDSPKKITLRVIAEDWTFGSYATFYYTIGSIEIRTNPITFSTFIKYINTFPSDEQNGNSQKTSSKKL